VASFVGEEKGKGKSKMKIEKILVAIDFSEYSQAAFEQAYVLVRQLGAKLYVLHVQDESTLRTAIKEGLLQADGSDEELQTAVRQLIEMRFAAALAGKSYSDVPMEHLSRRGDPKATLVQYAGEIDADLVVVGRRGVTAMSTIASVVLGSVAEYVIRHSPCPTLVVRTGHRR
jgi:nucleotide-binding universal stress UspA family protein